jgi:hypothetical protein
VLAVVQHQQHLALAQVLQQQVAGAAAPGLAQPERAGNGRRHQPVVA